MANKAIKYRVYPTTEQSIMFAKTFGCCRKVYNLMLSDKIEGYKATGKFPTVTPAKYKDEYPYLKEVDSLALANKQLDLQEAFRNRTMICLFLGLQDTVQILRVTEMFLMRSLVM